MRFNPRPWTLAYRARLGDIETCDGRVRIVWHHPDLSHAPVMMVGGTHDKGFAMELAHRIATEGRPA